jgi:hypothetical protein
VACSLIETNISEVLTASINRAVTALMMEAVSAFERVVSLCETTQYNISEDGHFQTYCIENLKYHPICWVLWMKLFSVPGVSFSK